MSAEGTAPSTDSDVVTQISVAGVRRTDGSSSDDEGLLRLSIPSHDSQQDATLEIILSSSTLVFGATVNPSSNRENWELLKSHLPSFSAASVQDNPSSSAAADSSFQTKYEYKHSKQAKQDNDDSPKDSIRMSLSKKLASGLVRVIWDVTLVPNAETSLFEVAQKLYHSQQTAQNQLERQKVAWNKLQSARDQWKETAQSLEGGWTKEKNELLANFLTLYKKQQEKTTIAEQGMKKLEEALDQKSKELQDALALKKQRTKGNFVDDEYKDLLDAEPDDGDQEVYTKDFIAKMAGSAPAVPDENDNQRESKKKPTNKKKRPPAKAESPKEESSPVVKKARNEATGAIEYFDSAFAISDLLSSDEEMEYTRNSKGKGQTSTSKSASSTNEAKAVDAKASQTKKEPNSSINSKTAKTKASATTKKAPPKKASKQNDRTPSPDNDSIDSDDMDSDILAQLAAMKEQEK